MIKKKLSIPYPILVEGKYDKAAVLEVAYATVVVTNGFGIFKSHEKKAVIRALTQKLPMIILTDSDGAGALIRSHIRSILPENKIISLYVPKIVGKEKRKTAFSAEGTLGVEGIDREIIYNILKPYENSEVFITMQSNPLSKTDFFNDGLCGKPNSTIMRNMIAEKFGLPSGMNANALLDAIKMIASYDEYKSAVKDITAQ